MEIIKWKKSRECACYGSGKPIFKFSKEKTFIKHGREIPKFYVRLRPQKIHENGIYDNY